MLSKQEEMRERHETLENDRKLREQGSAYIDHYVPEMGGRFASVGAATVIGSKADVAAAYPAASAAHQVQLPDEPSLGFDNPALETPVELPSFTQQATDALAQDAPSGSIVSKQDVERSVGASPLRRRRL